MSVMTEEVTSMRTTAIEFTEIARALQAECQRLGIVCPAMATPPRAPREARTIRRYPTGVVVRVRLDRDPHAVTADLVDGCIAANPLLEGDAVAMTRTALWEAAGLAVAA